VLELSTDDKCRISGKRKLHFYTNKWRKRKKTVLTTITHRWQQVWSFRFPWAKAEFDAHGNLSSVVCTSCTAMTGRRKVMVSKLDNLVKHEGKKTCQEDTMPLPHLLKGDTYVKTNCKHVKLYKLWTGRKYCGSVANQLNAGLDSEFKHKGMQFSSLFQILSHDRPMVDYDRS